MNELKGKRDLFPAKIGKAQKQKNFLSEKIGDLGLYSGNFEAYC